VAVKVKVVLGGKTNEQGSTTLQSAVSRAASPSRSIRNRWLIVSPLLRLNATMSPRVTVMIGLGLEVVPFQPTLGHVKTQPVRTIATLAAWTLGTTRTGA
jgi:hypothetical protein